MNLAKMPCEKERISSCSSDYIKSCYAYESVIMLRKLLVVLCSVFLTDSYQAQLLTLNVVIMLSLALQLYFSPFKSKRMNSLVSFDGKKRMFMSLAALLAKFL